MGTIIVEQFNPKTKCWNKLYEVDESKFNKNEPITVDKYGGQYRTRLVGVSVIEGVVVKKPTKKKSSKKKVRVPKGRLTRTIKDDSVLNQM